MYGFIGAGSTIVNAQEDWLYLDVGNRLVNGVIDHHHLHDGEISATRLVAMNPHLIPPKLKKIILHVSPDLDCVASSYLAKYYYKNRAFPEFAEELCDFLDKTDFGLKTKNLINLSTIFSLVKSSCSNDEEIIKKGHELIDEFAPVGFDSGEFPIKYQKQVNDIKKDIDIFESDFEGARKISAKLLKRNTLQMVDVEGLLLIKPRSKFFKYWARDRGYELLIVQWSQTRTVISLKGDSMFSLEGIGKKLNHLERIKREELGIHLDESNRDGYDMPDPWYDGRAHAYTIIDAPRRGTALDLDDILLSFN